MSAGRFDRRIPNWRGLAVGVLAGASLIAIVAFVARRSEQPSALEPARTPEGPPTGESPASPIRTGVAAAPLPTSSGLVPLGSTSAGVATTGGNAAPAADLGSEFRAQLEASPAFARMRACLAKGSTPAKAGGGDTATMVEFIVAGDGSIANVHEPADVRDCIKNASRGFGFRSRAERANVEFAVIVPMTAR